METPVKIMIKSKFSNLTYRDFVECNSLHFNSMRSIPSLPQAIIENNINQLRPFSHIDLGVQSKKSVYRPKRCLFSEHQVHLASLSSLTNLHLHESHDDDYLKREIGIKRKVLDARNGIEFKTLGDKSYRDVEYSCEFFNRSSKEWRSHNVSRRQNLTKETIRYAKRFIFYLMQRIHFFITTCSCELDDMTATTTKNEEIQNVQSLNNWRPASRLELPFKVLDLPNKSARYRPKVTR